MPRFSLLISIILVLASLISAADPATGPLRRQLDERLSAIDREITRRRSAGQEDSAKELSTQLQYFRDRLAGKAKPAGNDPQLHVITIYKGNTPNGPRQRFGNATVEVGVTDRPIILALGSYESVTWDVKIANDAQVKKIILGGYYEQELAAPLNNIPLEVHTYENKQRPYFYGSSEGESVANTFKALKQLTALTPATLQNPHAPEGKPLIIGPDNLEWTAQLLLSEIKPIYFEAMAFDRARQREALSRIRFKALQLERDGRFGFTAALAEFSPLGRIAGDNQLLPLRLNHLAIDPVGPAYYGINSNAVYSVDLKNVQATEIPVNDRNVPRLSWASGVAFDTKRRRLAVSSSHVHSYLYAYDPNAKQWSLLSELTGSHLYLHSLTYSPEHDCFFGFSKSPSQENLNASIARINADGAVEKVLPISQAMPSTPSGPNQGYQLIPAGRQLALLTPPLPDPENPETNISRCLLIDPDTGNVTYSGIMTPQPPPAPAALAAADFDALWKSALADDKSQSDAAMWKLASGGDKSIAYLREKLPALPQPDPDKLNATIAKLEHEDFKVRDEAANELVRLGPSISADLQAVLKREIPPNTRSNIETILKRIQAAATSENFIDNPDPSIRADARAIAILGRIATPKAVEALTDLAAGPPGLPRTTLAKSTLQSLGRD